MTDLDKKELKTKQKKGPRVTRSQLGQIVKLHLDGVSNIDISKTMNVNHNSIADIINIFDPILNDKNKLEEFRVNRINILTALEFRVLESMFSKEKLEEADFFQLGTIADKIQKMRRLEEGLSTSNASVHHSFSRPSLKKYE